MRTPNTVLEMMDYDGPGKLKAYDGTYELIKGSAEKVIIAVSQEPEQRGRKLSFQGLTGVVLFVPKDGTEDVEASVTDWSGPGSALIAEHGVKKPIVNTATKPATSGAGDATTKKDNVAAVASSVNPVKKADGEPAVPIADTTKKVDPAPTAGGRRGQKRFKKWTPQFPKD